MSETNDIENNSLLEERNSNTQLDNYMHIIIKFAYICMVFIIFIPSIFIIFYFVFNNFNELNKVSLYLYSFYYGCLYCLFVLISVISIILTPDIKLCMIYLSIELCILSTLFNIIISIVLLVYKI